jgi:hypothetical protein
VRACFSVVHEFGLLLQFSVEDDVISAHKKTHEFTPAKALIAFFCTHSRHSYPFGDKGRVDIVQRDPLPGCSFAERGSFTQTSLPSRSNELDL